MPNQNTIRFINAIVLGYVLTFSILILNHLDGDKIGVALALASFAAAYFAEVDYADKRKPTWFAFALQIVSILACAASYAVWLF